MASETSFKLEAPPTPMVYAKGGKDTRMKAIVAHKYGSPDVA